jgi:putative peptidoglycan lipid II flippase
LAANKNFEELRSNLTLGLRYVWFFCAPLAIFMICYREPIIRFFFKYGNFTESNVLATAQALLFYAMGIPAFCATKVLLPAYYSRKKMTTPLKISIFCIILNIPLSILLMFKLKQGGIALATVISAMCNNLLLLYFLKRDNCTPQTSAVIASIVRSLAAALLAVIPALFYSKICAWSSDISLKNIPDAVPLLFCGIFFAVVYLLCNLLMRAPELREILYSIKSRSQRKKGE